MIPDSALEGTRWEGQPDHVTMGTPTGETTASNLEARILSRVSSLCSTIKSRQGCQALLGNLVLEFEFQKMSAVQRLQPTFVSRAALTKYS